MDCQKEKNLKTCPCTYPPCPRKGICCQCLRHHLKNNELPACCFSKQAEKTYDRSIANFTQHHPAPLFPKKWCWVVLGLLAKKTVNYFMKIILVYIANSSEREAERIAYYLLNKKLIACANIFPIKSLYRWKGKIIKEHEFVLIAKTLAKNFNKIKKEIERIHSYDIPCVIKIVADSSGKYFNWLKNEIV